MKKICFTLVAAVLITSLCGMGSVFAALATGADYTIESYDGTVTFPTRTIAGTATGLNYELDVKNAPQKEADDAVYHISGTSKVTNNDCWQYTLKPAFDLTSASAVNRYNYTISFDIYPKKDMTFNVRGGFGSSNTNQRYDAVFNTIGETNPIALNRWSHVTINMQADNTNTDNTKHTFRMDIYVNGSLTETKTKWDAKYSGDISLQFANFSLNLVKYQEYDFYIDNFVTAASDNKFAQTAPTVSTVDGATGTLSGSEIELASGSITVAQLKSAVTAGAADNLSICRGDLIVSDTEPVRNGDLLCLKGANGLYTYYTVKLPFILGEPVINGSMTPGQTITASVSASGKAPQDITMIFVLYRGITHVETKTVTISKDDAASDMSANITIPEKDGNYSAKVFLWDSLSGMNSIE